ncbi:MAG: 2-oxoacid:acceptor oxidoreductase family protein [bacterium]|nr:2-oxoacid:acceptor oxidoreductase family protein [bacterium]MDD5354796.1 2-oxoacid:acceptor oxidoreductase family protein [bacterium]MDD5755961.1 2-oxoacid:acceptor oxidoreductase family protein [bacterium]
MGKLTEIRWHGRGGQGAKTAALLFADAALGEGLYIQAFPEYGPERMGAPVQSFDRLSDEPITIHCGVTNPSVVVVLDPTLIGKVDVIQGLPDNGAIIINTSETPKDIKAKLGLSKGKVYTVDASAISRETIGKDIPNTPMLGALAKVTGLINFERMVEDNRKKLTAKFKNRPEIVEGNIKSIQRAYQEVKGEE